MRFELLSEGDSSARALSADGKVVVGSIPGVTQNGVPARWTVETGFVPLTSLSEPIDSGVALAVSADGSVIAGQVVLGSGGGAFRWTQAEGVVPLELGPESIANDVSSNGLTIAGTMNGSANAHLYRWTAASGAQDLRTLGVNGTVAAMDAAGTVIVGSYQTDPDTIASTTPYIWKASGFANIGNEPGWASAITADGTTVLGYLSDDSTPFLYESTPSSSGIVYPDIDVVGAYDATMSADARVIAGRSSEGIWLWDEENGTRMLEEVLASFGVDVSDARLFNVTAISDDGRVLVGAANPGSSRGQTAYIVRL